MTTAVTILGCVACWLAVRYVPRYFSDKSVMRRELQRAPRTPIGVIQEGVVRITGRVVLSDDRLVAPLSGRECAIVELVITEASGEAEPSKRIMEARPFIVDDGTGRALIEPGAHLVVAVRHAPKTKASKLDARQTERVSLWWERVRGAISRSRPTDKSVRYAEGTISDGDVVSVGGYAHIHAHPVGNFRGFREPPALAVLRSGDAREPLLIADHPRGSSG